MMFIVNTDQRICEAEGISFSAATIFDVIKRLSNLSYITEKKIEERTYKVLYHTMILNQVPAMKLNSRALGRLIRELKDADLIQWDGSTMTPAYAFTEKSDKYIIDKKDDEVMGGKVEPKKRNQPILDLRKTISIGMVTPEYFKAFRKTALSMCQTKEVPVEEFEVFLEYHAKKGSKFANWAAAFATWCRNYKKFNKKANDGESDNGLYR
jgi:hypothetical protein